MDNRGDFRYDYSKKDDPFQHADPEDIELAYWLQNAPPNDPHLAQQLVQRYAGELYLWISFQLNNGESAVPLKEYIFSLLKKVFTTAASHTDQFQGTESIFTWLAAIASQAVSQWRPGAGWKVIRDERGSLAEEQGDSSHVKSVDWAIWEKLPKKVRLALILRYLFELKLPDIALVLDLKEKQVHRQLGFGRMTLMAMPTRPHFTRQIEALVDGMLESDEGKLELLERHIAGCSECQQSLAGYKSFETTFTEAVHSRWNPPVLSEAELESLAQAIVSALNQSGNGKSSVLPTRQVAWMVGLALMTIGVVFVTVRLAIVDRQAPQALSTPGQQMPPVIELPSTARFDSIAAESPPAPLYIAPAFSSDGNWAVFASFTYNANVHSIVSRTIDLYDRQSNTIQEINRSPGGDTSWVWWDLAPSISADGRWIVFVASTSDPAIAGDPCHSIYTNACMDILLYDRTTGQTRRLTQATKGGPADDHSLAPTISADGRWVAFWSRADNLVPDYQNFSQPSDQLMPRFYLYVDDLQTGKLEQLPIFSIPGLTVYGLDRISMSGDGRYLGFTLSSGTEIQLPSGSIIWAGNIQNYLYPDSPSNRKSLIPNHNTEAVVLDRQTGKFEMENISRDGQFGNQSSSSPVLSADGRYVAFVSVSTNLLPGGTSDHANVFVRDRLTGQVDLASVSSSGEQGSGDSGVGSMEFGYYTVNLSGDGRFVVFESTAPNLGTSSAPTCSIDETGGCNYLYIHDQLTGSTAMISALPNQDFTMFPDVSLDGRMISYMQYFHNCSSTQLRCSNVMLYDQQSGWTTNLTNYDQQIPDLHWVSSGNITLPWQAWESNALAISPDGKWVAVGGMDSLVRLWYLPQSGSSGGQAQLVTTLTAEGNVAITSLTFSADGGWIAGGTSDGSVYVWNIVDGKVEYRLGDLPAPVRTLVFNKDSLQLILATADRAWIWLLGANQVNEVPGFLHTTDRATVVDISPVGNLIASMRSDGTIWLQSLPVGNLVTRLGIGMERVNNLAFSPDGSQLAASLGDGTIFVWRIQKDGSQISSVTFVNQFSTEGSSGGLAFSQDGVYLAATGLNGVIPVWNVLDGELHSISSSIPNEWVYSLVFSRDGSSLAVVFEDEIVLWGIPSQSQSRFFLKATTDSIMNSTAFASGIANDLPQLQESVYNLRGIYVDLGQTAVHLDYPLVVPSNLPDKFIFTYASINNAGGVYLRYSAYNAQGYQSGIFIYEMPVGNTPVPAMLLGESADITSLLVENPSGSLQAEYVLGDWQWQHSFTAPDNDSLRGQAHSVWYWNSSLPSQRLRWIQNGVLIALYYDIYIPASPALDNSSQAPGSPALSTMLGENDLLKIAAGMSAYIASCTGPECTTFNQMSALSSALPVLKLRR